jgi:SAM-dependent methyltransferase
LRKTPCVVCDSNDWLSLPDPAKRKSITTAGLIVDEPLGKMHCRTCGLVARTEYNQLGNSDYYENHYTPYYERPGTEVFNARRYAAMARWISVAITPSKPASIIEVGCGRGWTLCELAKLYPQATIDGIEPSRQNSDEARRHGFRIWTQKLGPDNLPDNRYDIVFSNHVLQHTTDPIGFLSAMGRLARDRGLVVVAVDISGTSNELLFSDQNFSLLPGHLVRLAEKAGLKVLAWQTPPDHEHLMFSQMIVCCKSDDASSELPVGAVPEYDVQKLADLYGRRIQYLEAWRKIDEFLRWKTSGRRTVYNFGGGMYSYLLACYCEKYWSRVAACTVDGFSGTCVGKEVVPLETLRADADDCVVTGTRPILQKQVAARLRTLGWEAVSWDNFIEG